MLLVLLSGVFQKKDIPDGEIDSTSVNCKVVKNLTIRNIIPELEEIPNLELNYYFLKNFWIKKKYLTVN